MRYASSHVSLRSSKVYCAQRTKNILTTQNVNLSTPHATALSCYLELVGEDFVALKEVPIGVLALGEQRRPVVVLGVVPQRLPRSGVEVKHFARVPGLARLPGLWKKKRTRNIMEM